MRARIYLIFAATHFAIIWTLCEVDYPMACEGGREMDVELAVASRGEGYRVLQG